MFYIVVFLLEQKCLKFLLIFRRNDGLQISRIHTSWIRERLGFTGEQLCIPTSLQVQQPHSPSLHVGSSPVHSLWEFVLLSASYWLQCSTPQAPLDGHMSKSSFDEIIATISPLKWNLKLLNCVLYLLVGGITIFSKEKKMFTCKQSKISKFIIMTGLSNIFACSSWSRGFK